MSFEEGSYNVDEGDTVDVTVTLNADPAPYRLTKTNKTAHRALTTRPTSVEFASWRDGADAAQDQRLTGNLTKEATVSITDDDVPTVTELRAGDLQGGRGPRWM